MRVRTERREGHGDAVALLMACLLALGASRPATAEDAMVVVRYQDAKFVALDPARPDGPQMAVLWGDPDTGPSAMLLKMRKTTGRLHYHTSDYDLVLVEGQMQHWAGAQEAADTPTLGPGSYWHQPKMQPHGDSCVSDACVMFVKWAGKRDAVLATAGAPPSSR